MAHWDLAMPSLSTVIGYRTPRPARRLPICRSLTRKLRGGPIFPYAPPPPQSIDTLPLFLQIWKYGNRPDLRIMQLLLSAHPEGMVYRLT
jgi:hypothetical protein